MQSAINDRTAMLFFLNFANNRSPMTREEVAALGKEKRVPTLVDAAADLPPVGDGASAPFTHVAPYYIEQGHEQTGASNLVTAVLADYRGYDTLGELTVIFTAGVACLLVVSGKDGGSPRQDKGKA